jgi:hypothetical protein
MLKQHSRMSQEAAVDLLERDIWSDGRDMRGYPAALLRRYLNGEVTLEVCVGYKNGDALKWVAVDMLYYIERTAAFVQKKYGRSDAENGSELQVRRGPVVHRRAHVQGVG